ncbi:hypothetical protein A2954_01835 [Candidatus Roizmanbacteria bacterium RIFCSPLOWO2_01_FULL_37_12]|uniref:Uncharacterized protein n=1 Tax=Candidatus Roizmanbacteria bacterium RIFCSPLOWO2_01_FULL_37_12 TaxID=1802056 RepID=A0A1F7I9E5_9BACT|nr:MAG: hypothetical protein A2768_01135 [Candidatus Roizmanbacteria bacterium RIFCSPHIGHO2_01_FULL_37_16]OGK24493.1 MAG: hypothetical protein A3D76_05690 [Candidatus Roizmanbacteria bacterium RIFCSPHIGHO2_02_FULL_37_9b]OGK39988.1 MAG: hypothetical protein A2954_01835 [Candidatus Roizmanbacteria bacterium RIFCSPLOWO2_01_FULL_37_12]
MKIVKFFFSLLIIAIIGCVIYLGYLGFIPIVSNIMGANKPKDLGIKYTKENYDSYIQKGGTEIKYVKTGGNPADSVKLSGIKNVKDNFSQEDISARLNYSNWKYMPVKNTQVRINKGGTVEFSANVIMNRLPGFIAYTGLGKYSVEDVNKGLKYINLLKVDPPIYLKFKASVKHNLPDLEIQIIQVGKYILPLEKLGANQVITQAVENVFLKANGFHAMSAKFSDGQLIFDGTVPAVMEVESN